MNIPVYLVTGFLESGKTSFLKEIFRDKDFLGGEENLLIVCEEGEVEFDKNELKNDKTTLVVIEDEEELTKEYLKELENKYKPKKIFIEYNGMWSIDNLFDNVLPENLEVVQIMTTIDSSTFSAYMSNMGSIIVDQFRYSDLVVFNRCNKDTKKISLRGSIKAVNRQARVIFENENGEIDNSEDVLPYDINVEIIEPEEYDFGILFEDMMGNPAKYENKKIKAKMMAFNPDKYPPQFCVLGREAMTCCEDDITPLGLICRFKDDVKIKDKEWVEVTAVVHKRRLDQYDEDLPVLYVEEISKAEEPEDGLVYFY